MFLVVIESCYINAIDSTTRAFAVIRHNKPQLLYYYYSITKHTIYYYIDNNIIQLVEPIRVYLRARNVYKMHNIYILYDSYSRV